MISKTKAISLLVAIITSAISALPIAFASTWSTSKMHKTVMMRVMKMDETPHLMVEQMISADNSLTIKEIRIIQVSYMDASP